MWKEFKSPKSDFRNEAGEKVEYGGWVAPYFDYIVIGDKQWLIVSDQQKVMLKNGWHTLQPRGEISVSGLVGLEKPGTYFKWHKSLGPTFLVDEAGNDIPE